MSRAGTLVMQFKRGDLAGLLTYAPKVGERSGVALDGAERRTAAAAAAAVDHAPPLATALPRPPLRPSLPALAPLRWPPP